MASEIRGRQTLGRAGGRVDPPRRPGRHRLAPGLEGLDRRALPSTFVVTNALDDGGPGSLRGAISLAEASPGDQTISFDPAAFARASTIRLTRGEIELGDHAGTITIDGSAVSVALSGEGRGRVILLDPGATATLRGLTITDGEADGNGGGVSNDAGTLTMVDCTVVGNVASGRGGGVGNSGGTSTLIHCTVDGNSALDGGGLSNVGGMVLLDGSTVGDNTDSGRGGGLFNTAGLTVLDQSTVIDNTSADNGGGVFNNGTTILDGSIIRGNLSLQFGGGVCNDSDAAVTTLSGCVLTGNASGASGGGLCNTDGTAALTDCAFRENTAGQLGDGLFQDGGDVTVINCTFSDGALQAAPSTNSVRLDSELLPLNSSSLELLATLTATSIQAGVEVEAESAPASGLPNQPPSAGDMLSPSGGPGGPGEDETPARGPSFIPYLLGLDPAFDVGVGLPSPAPARPASPPATDEGPLPGQPAAPAAPAPGPTAGRAIEARPHELPVDAIPPPPERVDHADPEPREGPATAMILPLGLLASRIRASRVALPGRARPGRPIVL